MIKGIRWFCLAIVLIIGLHVHNLGAVITDGEKLIFTVKYGLIAAAEATLEIKSTTFSNKDAWLISSKARTYPFFDGVFTVRDTIRSWWEKDSLRTLRLSKYMNEGAYRQFRVITYNHDKNTASYQRWNFKKQSFKTKQINIPHNTQDILSAFYKVRQMNLNPGKTVFVDITVDGKSVRTEVVVHRRETINSIFGDKECLVIEPKLKSEGIFKQSDKVLIWITDDKYKVPLKMTSKIIFGAFSATLINAKNVPYAIK